MLHILNDRRCYLAKYPTAASVRITWVLMNCYIMKLNLDSSLSTHLSLVLESPLREAMLPLHFCALSFSTSPPSNTFVLYSCYTPMNSCHTSSTAIYVLLSWSYASVALLAIAGIHSLQLFPASSQCHTLVGSAAQWALEFITLRSSTCQLYMHTKGVSRGEGWGAVAPFFHEERQWTTYESAAKTESWVIYCICASTYMYVAI